MPRKKSLDLVLAIDFGSSSTKAIYKLANGELASLVMEPEVVRLPVESLKAYEDSKLSSSTPENEAWVGFGDTYYVVGYLADSEFPGSARLRDVKSRVAVAKTGALIWAIKQKHQLDSKTLRVALTTVLPIGEYADRDKFETQLRELSGGFETPTGEMKVEMLDFDCKPEGAGVYSYYRNSASDEIIYRETLVCLMLGYRNVTALISDRGRVSSKPIMSDLGMRVMLERVHSNTSGLDSKRLLAAIISAGDEVESGSFWKVCKSKVTSERSDEAEVIAAAVSQARSEYMALLTNWIREILPEKLDRVIIAGGTGEYLRTYFESSFVSTPLVFHGNVEIPAALDTWGYGYRLADVFGLFSIYLDQVLRQFDKSEVETESQDLAEVSN
ncbi:MAG: ParM/StbA family protein [Oscillatoria sp. PMC 1051.18]|nr:ParM/StbA family protein [Oscillatoria sp. PMC 1050.18]MEC5033215.1 ParM/StbA family protein [Oscillatoria sp. PMC 1051.18]